MLNFIIIKENELSSSKVINVHDWQYATPSASCINGRHAVDITARHRRGISWYPSHGMRSTLQWSYYSLAWDAVTGGPATSRGLEIWRPIYRHAAQRGWGYTLQYCSHDNTRASTDRGSLTRYVCGGAFHDAFKALCTLWFAFMAALTQRC